MSLTPAMPFVQIREWGDDAKLLAGGKIYFYAKGTTTPKATWQDADATAFNENPVVLDAGGSAHIYCSGAYSYKITRIDAGIETTVSTGDFTTEGTTAGAGSIGVYANYDALESSTGADLIAVVVDGYNLGDRAGGVFLRDNSQAATITDGVAVVGPAFKYLRAYNGNISAEWCGVQWNGTSQGVNVERAIAASVRYGSPVEFDLPFQIERTIQVSAGASVVLADQCIVSGSIVVNWNFVQGSQLVSCAAGCFGPNVRPKFDFKVYDHLLLSWCKGSTDDETLTQFLGMPNDSRYTIQVDKDLDAVGSTNFVTTSAVAFTGGRIKFVGSANISIASWHTPPARKIFEFDTLAHIGTITLPCAARPEWFGAVGDGVADDSIPVQAALKSGSVAVSKSYSVAQSVSGSTVCIKGAQPIALNVNTMSVAGTLIFGANASFTNLTVEDALIVAPNSVMVGTQLTLNRAAMSNAGATQVAGCGYLKAYNSFLQVRGQISVGGNSVISGMIYTTTNISWIDYESARVNVRGLYCPDITSATVLGTDSSGKVIAKTSLLALTITTATITTANVTILDAADASIGKLYHKSETVLDGETLSVTKSRAVIDNSSVAASVTLPSAAGNDQTFELVGKTNARGFTVNVPAGNTFAGIGGTSFAVSASSACGLPRAVVFRQYTEWFISTGGL